MFQFVHMVFTLRYSLLIMETYSQLVELRHKRKHRIMKITGKSFGNKDVAEIILHFLVGVVSETPI